jgi:PilZ domain-containing protein
MLETTRSGDAPAFSRQHTERAYLVSADRRTSPRRILRCAAKIVVDRATGPLRCTVIDMSNTGVRLSVGSNIPDEFALILNDATGVRHKCQLIWRRDQELGAKFIGLEAR